MSVTYPYPGVYIEEIPSGSHSIQGVATSITAFIGQAADGPMGKPVSIQSYEDFERIFGGLRSDQPLGYAVRSYYENGGSQAIIVRLEGNSLREAKNCLEALDKVDQFNLLCIPPYLENGNIDEELYATAAEYCEKRRAMFIVDPPAQWRSLDDAKAGLAVFPVRSPNAAIYFPRIRQPDPLREYHAEELVPCGIVAGVIARTDAQQGVWKPPAGFDANMVGVLEYTVTLIEPEVEELIELGFNCLKSIAGTGPVIWGARTLQAATGSVGDWEYVPVRRTALYIEESLSRGIQWALSEPSTETLWTQVRQSADDFMLNLYRQGAFQGAKPEEAYFVKCDASTTTQAELDNGVFNILVGFAALRPAEFVTLKIQGRAGQKSTGGGGQKKVGFLSKFAAFFLNLFGLLMSKVK